MQLKGLSFWVGIFIVVFTHLGMILNLIPIHTGLSSKGHAIVNLVAAGLILYSHY